MRQMSEEFKIMNTNKILKKTSLKKRCKVTMTIKVSNSNIKIKINYFNIYNKQIESLDKTCNHLIWILKKKTFLTDCRHWRGSRESLERWLLLHIQLLLHQTCNRHTVHRWERLQFYLLQQDHVSSFLWKRLSISVKRNKMNKQIIMECLGAIYILIVVL